MMAELAGETCVPCRGGEPTLGEDELEALLPEIPGWRVEERGGVKRLERSFRSRTSHRRWSSRSGSAGRPRRPATTRRS